MHPLLFMSFWVVGFVVLLFLAATVKAAANRRGINAFGHPTYADDWEED